MPNQRPIYVRFCAIIIASVLSFACVRAAAESLDASIADLTIHATAVTSNVFRVSIATSAKPAHPINTIFLDPSFVPGDLGQLAGPHNLRTDSGELDLDPATAQLSLQNAKGAALLPPALIAEPTTIHSQPALALHLGWPQNRPFDIYACGNGSNHLLQHAINTHVDNGIAVEPFFWSPAGFASFVVGADPNAPAQCDGTVDHNAITWIVPGTSADLYLILAPTLGDASRTLLTLTGRPPVPPRWTFGYLQSRWGWKSPAYITETLNQFRTRKLPVDAFIFDFEWYTKFPDYEVKREGEKNFSDFRFNPDLFPDPVAQLKQLHDAGVHFVGIRKPRLGNSAALALIRSKGWDFRGGRAYDARDLQFNNPALRAWYADKLEPLLKDGVDGWWDDEGEFTYTTYTYWNAAERQALDAVRPAARLWTLDRAFQPGSARWGAAAWTGDIHATWDDLRDTPAALLNWSIAGMPFVTCDIGGFHGETNPQLLTRWMEAGTFFPVMRTHSELTVQPHFPWLFGADAESAIRKTLNLRYRLIPYLYSVAHQTADTGEPLMRPLLMQYPNDPNVADLSSEWLLGTQLLAAPILSRDNHRSIYLPDDTWYDFATGERISGSQQFDRDVPFDAVPLFVRAGSILPLAPPIQHTADLPGGPLDLQIYPGRDASFTLVEDDGSTTAYQSGNLRKTTFTWTEATRTLAWKRIGPYAGSDCFRDVRITLHDRPNAPTLDHPLSPDNTLTIGS